MNEIPREKDAGNSPNQSKDAQESRILDAKRKSEQNPIVTNASQQECGKKPGIDKPAWIQAMSTVAIVCITAFYTYYAHRSATASIRAANAAKAAADVAKNTFDQNKDFADSTLREMKKQSTAMQDAATAAKSQAATSQTALDAASAASQLDQRAWVSANVSAPKIEFDKPAIMMVSTSNSGKTFACRAVITSYTRFASHELTTLEELKRGMPVREPASVALLAPNVTYQTTITVPSEDIPKIEQRLGLNGFTYVWGDISYNDVFRKPHVTQYCGYRSQASGSIEFLQCKFHTDAN
jgi:hypothetical protein